MFHTFFLSCCSLAILPSLLFSEPGNDLSVRNFTVGESGLFYIKPELGISYCWSVSDKVDRINGVESDKVTYLSSRYYSTVKLKWDRAGLFFITVTGFNQHGCSNSKVFMAKVFENHVPVANDDYNIANWLNCINMNLLDNDFDAGKDLDTSSLKILTKPRYGEVTAGKNGSIVYYPFRNLTGTERLHYRICDSLNQCDSAMVVITIKEPPLFLPQGISPNGDGVNDSFVISGLNAYPKSSLTIFSRDGIIVFNSDDYQNDWKGRCYNQKRSSPFAPAGTYYYLLQPGGSSRVIKGFIYLTY